MSDDEMRIAIASRLGIAVFQTLEGGDWYGMRVAGKWERVPDYLNDLNAMREAEETLFSKGDWAACEYEARLQKITTSWAWHATARQRAEAFIQTIKSK